MIKRSSKHVVEQILEKNNWSVLDIGCGYTPSKYANVICDTQNLEGHYKDKKFVQLKDKRLPFEDKEFDFVIASHVLEHVEDPEFFLNEIQRVSSFGGYIEVPTKLEPEKVKTAEEIEEENRLKAEKSKAKEAAILANLK